MKIIFTHTILKFNILKLFVAEHGVIMQLINLELLLTVIIYYFKLIIYWNKRLWRCRYLWN
jgi:hypothetical protein